MAALLLKIRIRIEILLQQASEFLRIAEILIDTDVLVLRAIYAQQKNFQSSKYRETERG